jgi:sugar O-acyltransferase (sialic acid O-acetyltransferase NeuD family)
MKKIILIGGGGHCKSVIDVIEQEKKYKIYGIVDKPKFLGTKILGYRVIGSDLDLENLAKKYKNAIITVGQVKSPSLRIKLFNLANKAGFKFPSIISPKAYVSKHSSVSMGTIVMHNAVVNANVVIGSNCIINTKSLIEHDCKISNHSHISTNATINGGVKIKSKSFIGSNATIRDGVEIKENSFIKANTLVI